MSDNYFLKNKIIDVYKKDGIKRKINFHREFTLELRLVLK